MPGSPSLAFKQIGIEVLTPRGLRHGQAPDLECFSLHLIETVKSLRLLRVRTGYQIIERHRAVESIAPATAVWAVGKRKELIC